MPGPVRDNPARNRFEMDVDGDLAIANYRLSPGVVVITHTEVPDEVSGRGYGSTLVRGMLDQLRGRGVKVVPQCSFVAGFIRRHPDYKDMVA